MKYSRSIKIKAFSLLAVFSLNTVVGFACSIGMDLGYNNSHHKEVIIEPSVHIHEDDSHHQHKYEAAKKAVHDHDEVKMHEHHNDLQKAGSDATKLPGDEDCCSDEVYKFNNLDKNLTQQKASVEYLTLSMIIYTFFSIAASDNNNNSLLHSSRYLFPPPPDILLSIQKFQI